MKKVIVTGANGQLGADICSQLKGLGYAVIELTHQDAELTDLPSIQKLIEEHKPDVFINTAAFHHVDQCEADFEKAMGINCTAPAMIANFCKKTGIKFVHFSTDYVFDGRKKAPYVESDKPHPLNNYGLSKWNGEESILKENEDSLILRVSAIYGVHPCRAKNGLNFVQLMLKKAAENASLKVVEDEIVSPTSTESIAKILPELLNQEVQGLVHLTSEGECSWYEFAKEIFDYTHTKADLSPSLSADNPAKTPRPHYSVLENMRLKKMGINHMPHWKQALHHYLDQTVEKK